MTLFGQKIVVRNSRIEIWDQRTNDEQMMRSRFFAHMPSTIRFATAGDPVHSYAVRRYGVSSKPARAICRCVPQGALQ